METAMQSLRLNIGDASEARVYYLPHYLAARAGYFSREDIAVAFVESQTGGHTAMGGQIGPVVDGFADACVGGPMVTMKLLEDGVDGIVSFCGLVRANPWVVAAAAPVAGGFSGLAGKTVIDSGNVITATLCLREALRVAGLESAVAIEAGSGCLDDDIARAEGDPSIVIHHSLHALGPDRAAGRLTIVDPMAKITPAVPWSAYIARSDRLAAEPDLFRRFRDGIAAALRDIATLPAERIADLVGDDYPGYEIGALTDVIDAYRSWGCFSPTPQIARADMIAFADIMQRAGWLGTKPSPDTLLAAEIAA
ncbi:hypothetical protein AXW83_15200 [Bosea sp. PAMC 26642]|nr:hypothetical protein AXW83_15200 [Bosea sp. PAMC 26642]